MRIRLSIQLRIERDRDDETDTTEDAPTVADKGSANVERADPHPVGFTIPAPPDPYTDRRRGT